MQKLIYKNKDHLSAGVLLGGYDKYEGPSLFEIVFGGPAQKSQLAMSGSGSIFIYSWADRNWRENMTEPEARQMTLFCRSLIVLFQGIHFARSCACDCKRSIFRRLYSNRYHQQERKT